jgi:DNA-binding SARP family transcriptional activator
LFSSTAPKQRALFTVLALRLPDPVSVDELLEALWADQPPGRGVQALQKQVSRLRHRLGPTVPLRHGTIGYALDIDAEALDSRRFERLLQQARDALTRGDPQSARDDLESALGLWHGPVLADQRFESFAQVEIGRLEELRMEAIEERMAAELAAGRDADLVGELRALVAEHPLRERVRGHLMVALYHSGRQAEALEVMRDGRLSLPALLIRLERRLDVLTEGRRGPAGATTLAAGDAGVVVGRPRRARAAAAAPAYGVRGRRPARRGGGRRRRRRGGRGGRGLRARQDLAAAHRRTRPRAAALDAGHGARVSPPSVRPEIQRSPQRSSSTRAISSAIASAWRRRRRARTGVSRSRGWPPSAATSASPMSGSGARATSRKRCESPSHSRRRCRGTRTPMRSAAGSSAA